MPEGVTATSLAPLAHDLSLWSLFLQADWVVKSVMVMLLLASVWVWAVVFEKAMAMRRLNKAADAFEDRFWSGGSLDELFEREGDHPTHPIAAVFGAAMREWRRGAAKAAGADVAMSGVQSRAERAMVVTISREMERLERWMVFLATVGSAAPFVGLFGTVWGIMNSFSAIAGMQSTNLAVVAPGIAEALFATAIGLVAAIPATIFYNKISTDLSRYAARLEAFASEFSAILSRQAEDRGA
ncbi:cell division and transport-associated protein TolQ [Humitalea rosea]|uniref:Tol-Pal system protein TolQ n=1 Tax=Humitalea rosea TaxID=990373 RepID=A0A2W7IAS1_9PROT|nr:protein TolQ [Humitalea rosea]PZW43198.1 cell division and transport-associated protein TolQ [Humitalea rosea]